MANDQPRQWLPMMDAPKDATWIELFVPDERGFLHPVVAHWAHGGGDDQPPFGPAWFKNAGTGTHAHYVEVHGNPAAWRPIAEPATP